MSSGEIEDPTLLLFGVTIIFGLHTRLLPGVDVWAWDSSRVAQMVIRQVRLIILTSHELLQQKQHSKQVSALTYEPCTVPRSHPWRTESGQDGSVY